MVLLSIIGGAVFQKFWVSERFEDNFVDLDVVNKNWKISEHPILISCVLQILPYLPWGPWEAWVNQDLEILFLQIIQTQYLFRGFIDLDWHDGTELLPNI